MSVVTVTEMLTVVVEEYLHEYPGYDEEDFIDFVVAQTHGSNGTGLLNKLLFGVEGLIAFYKKRIDTLERDAKVVRK